ncbi:hypothetical protein BS50DRAFT_559362 [Corynespora cassiicola Philippines]|uniref:DUF7896 domain-containing protein n=1 Tax=Corynespora cassiicola Philippines TaxID=1448308 RepID=A0A2T2ND66_CORCC|nr:hypothetical protein BS50DRAFT_559362 [Corynespora cassiicola Philippines]
MATALGSDSSYMQLLEQARLEFYSHHAHLDEHTRQQLWSQTVSSGNLHNAAAPQNVPRSMSSYPPISQMPQNLGSMDRTQSAPAAVAMGRSISTPLAADNNTLQHRSYSTMSNWQQPDDQCSGGYALYSESASARGQSALQPIDETSTFPPASMVEYTPAEYINNCIESSRSPLSHPHPHSHQLQVQLTSNSQWSPSLDGSISPSTPALMTPVTTVSNDMSRQSSYNPQLFDQVSMLRVHSDSSAAMFPLLSEDGSISFSSFDVDSKPISASVDTSNFPIHFTGLSSESFLSPAHVSASASALASCDNSKPYLAEDMRRSASTSSESNASSASAPSTSSRQSRREREINAQASRKIAPKAIERNHEASSASSNVTMMRIQSEDGSSKNVGVITKAPYIRPQHPKIMCQYCNERPEGFRGTHELDRHIARAHAAVRKGFICVDASPDKKFLANCKHCRNRKVYGAYYNAAAHLRRAHFHPRKRGRKGKHDEKRGGIGGGDHPPMETLKQFWIMEIEVENKIALSPESASESAEPINNGFDSTYDPMEATYQQPPAQLQPTLDSTNPIDSSQFMDFNGMYMNASEPMYDATTQFATYDPNNFQFDAYTAHP